MSEQTVLPVQASDQGRVWATLVVAFAADPVERWLYPDAEQYLACFPAFLAAFGGRAFDAQTMTTCSPFSVRWLSLLLASAGELTAAGLRSPPKRPG